MALKFTVYMRLLVYARRIARTLISIDISLKTMAQCAQSQWEKDHAPKPKVRPTEFSTVDIGAINEEYHQRQVELGLEDS